MKRIILTTAEVGYLDILKAFLASHRIHGTDCPILCDLLNGNPDVANRLQAIYPNLRVNLMSCEWTQDNSQNLLNLMYTRPPQMWKALNEGWEQVCSMDCDIVIRGNIAQIWDGVEPDVIKIFIKKEKEGNAKIYFQGGVYLFGNSENIRDYYKAIMDKIGTKWSFYDGQSALYTELQKFTTKLRLLKLPRTFNDERKEKRSNDSLVWHIKHGQIKTEPWNTEFKKYFNEANKYYDN